MFTVFSTFSSEANCRASGFVEFVAEGGVSCWSLMSWSTFKSNRLEVDMRGVFLIFLCEIPSIRVLDNKTGPFSWWLGGWFHGHLGLRNYYTVQCCQTRVRFSTVITTPSTVYLILSSALFPMKWFWHALF